MTILQWIKHFKFMTSPMFLFLVASVVLGIILIIKANNELTMRAFSIVLGSLILVYLSFFVGTLKKNPTSLRIGLVGLPGSGKTVFLSVLFNEIQVQQKDRVEFQPYGRETIEEVARNLNILASGQWLPPTESGVVFPFRANVRVTGGLFPKRYTVEIGDYAGEHTKEFDSSSEQWLHRTKYFEYIIDSDVLFLAIDGETLIESSTSETERMQNNLVAALQVLLEKKGVQPGRKTSMPIAVLILKADRLKTKEVEDFSTAKIDRILTICKNRCLKSEVFFVSSVGSVTEGGSPPKEIHPVNVCEPMIWAMRAVAS